MHRKRILLLAAALLFIGALLGARLFELQVVQAEEWRSESELLGARQRTIPFRRGSILDRSGRVIAVDEETFALDLEYATLRLKSPLGQVTHALSVLEGRTVEFREIGADPERAAARLLAVTPAQIAAVPLKPERDALRGLLAAWLRLRRAETRRLTAAVTDRSSTSIEAMFPDESRLAAGELRRSADAFGLLDDALEQPRGWCFTELEARRMRIAADTEEWITRAIEAPGGPRIDPSDLASERAARRKQREGWLERFAEPIPYAAAELVSARPERFAGLSAVESTLRRYLDPVLPQVIGAVAHPDAGELAAARRARDRMIELVRSLSRSAEEERELEELRRALRESVYVPGDVRGAGGIEKLCEPTLRGVRGWVLETPSRRGGEREVAQSSPPEDGVDAEVTLDLDLQRAAEKALASGIPGRPDIAVRGAIAVVEVETGDVLALAASPDYTREDLKDKRRYEALRLIEEEPTSPVKPLSHRGFQPYFPPSPGSVFKVVTALTAMEAGILTPTTRFRCEGRIGTLGCDGVHGDIDFRRAMEESCNVYFGHLGELLGRERLIAGARRFGFGSKTGFSDREFAGRFELEDGSPEMLRRFAVGYALLVTPLQIARCYAAIARGGTLPKLRSVRAIGGKPVPLEPPVDLEIDPDLLRTLTESLRGVVTHGTASKAGFEPFHVSAKTGTAEIDAKGLLNHAWLAGYAPFEAPRIAFAAYVERVPLHGKEIAPLLRHLFSSEAMAPYLRVP